MDHMGHCSVRTSFSTKSVIEIIGALALSNELICGLKAPVVFCMKNSSEEHQSKSKRKVRRLMGCMV